MTTFYQDFCDPSVINLPSVFTERGKRLDSRGSDYKPRCRSTNAGARASRNFAEPVPWRVQDELANGTDGSDLGL